jgi:AraC-like DNA-binding protein
MKMQPALRAVRPNEALRYWRHHDLEHATLMQARYGPFKWEKHVHDEQVVVISEHGAGEVQTRRGRELGGPGTIWVFTPGEYHFGKVEDGGEWQYRALYLDQAALDGIAHHLGIERRGLILKPGLHDDPNTARVLLRTHARGGSGRADAQVAWTSALATLFERYADPRPRLDAGCASAAALNLAREYIAEHFRDDISIDDLAHLANLSRYHFIRAFRSAFGIPPHGYLNQVRLQHARKLLLAGRSAVHAAIESGFYDQSRLSNLFKRAYGVTPAQYAHLARL